MRQFAQPAEVRIREREQNAQNREQAEIESRRQAEEIAEIHALGESGPGKRLRETYERKFESALTAWLDGDAGDAVMGVRTHQKLRDCREIIRQLTPLSREDDS